MPTTDRSAAVIDQAPDDSWIVWHVAVHDSDGQGTLTGAWIVNPDDKETLANLVEDRLFISLERVALPIAGIDLSAENRINTNGTLEAVRMSRDRLQAAFEAHIRDTKKKLVAPSWPKLPEPLDLKCPPPVTTAHAVTHDALSVSRWFSELLKAWRRLAVERAAREFLADVDVPHKLPLQKVDV